MQLSKNFHLNEFIISQTASRRNINNVPPSSAVQNLQYLCIKTLQPIRDHVDKPVIITSGYRSPELNKAIGGSATSQHMIGQAADFYIPGITIADSIILIQRLGVPFDQLIAEFGSWVHISVTSGVNRKMVFSIG